MSSPIAHKSGTADAASAVESHPVVIALSGKRDENVVAEALRDIKRTAAVLDDPAEAVDLVGTAAVLVLDQELLDRKTLAEIGMAILAQPPWSDLPIMVVTARGIPLSRELLELAERTNLVFVERPLRRSLLKAMLRSAVQTRERQFQTRKLMNELQTARDNAEAATRAKSAFLSQMSHDIRTPLTSIMGFAEILHEQVEPSLSELSEEILESGQRLMETMNSVLELARLEGRRTRLMLRPLRVIDELARVERVFQSAARERGLSLQIKCDPDIYVQADASALGRVLMNIVGNAVKFTPSGMVRIEASRSDDNVQILVRDTGIGISEAFLPKAFDAFQREATGITGAADGSGLGLTISKRLTELMNGTIKVESRHGVGTTVSMDLPRAEPLSASHESMAERPLPQARMSEKPRVLFVEDNPSTRNVIRHLAEDIMDARIVGGYDEAIRALRDEHFDMGFIDINLGEHRTGEDLLKEIQELNGYASTPFVAFTAFVLPEELERFMNRGFVACLNKPFTRDELMGAATEALQPERMQVNRAG